jgi:hypothetical protein
MTKRNQRGFRIYASFKDEMGATISVVESSIATRRCVWIQNEVCFCGADKEPIGNAHLTVTMARRVIKALQSFVDGA